MTLIDIDRNIYTLTQLLRNAISCNGRRGANINSPNTQQVKMHWQATEIKLFRGAVGTSAIGQEDQWSAFSWSLEPPTQSQINLQGVFLLLLPIFSTNMKKRTCSAKKELYTLKISWKKLLWHLVACNFFIGPRSDHSLS